MNVTRRVNAFWIDELELPASFRFRPEQPHVLREYLRDVPLAAHLISMTGNHLLPCLVKGNPEGPDISNPVESLADPANLVVFGVPAMYRCAFLTVCILVGNLPHLNPDGQLPPVGRRLVRTEPYAEFGPGQADVDDRSARIEYLVDESYARVVAQQLAAISPRKILDALHVSQATRRCTPGV